MVGGEGEEGQQLAGVWPRVLQPGWQQCGHGFYSQGVAAPWQVRHREHRHFVGGTGAGTAGLTRGSRAKPA